ncbi:MAG: hypothetical protein ACLP9L_30550 [Thermoguttaceae bacterium]
MDLRDALTQIAEIRAHIAQNETFRGYRSATVAASGFLALLGAAIQTLWIPDPPRQLAVYLMLWIGVATVSFLIFATEIVLRSYWNAAPQARQLTLLAVQQFAPCLVAGGLLTYSIVVFVPTSVALLPGLWAIVFSLGIFASCRLLPATTIWIAGYYLLSGTAALVFARGENSLSPWSMAGTFGAGQLLAATILFLALERGHGQV